MSDNKKLIKILTGLTIIGMVLLYILLGVIFKEIVCEANNVIIIQQENKKGQGIDIIYHPKRKHNKTEIRTRF